MATTNFYIGPQDGWVQVADVSAFVRISAWPATHAFYVSEGSSAPATLTGGLYMQYMPFIQSSPTGEKIWVRVRDPVHNSTQGDGRLRLDVLTVAASTGPFPVSLFGAGDNGAYYEPTLLTAYTDSALTTLARSNESVKGLFDFTGKGNKATITGNDSTCRLMQDVTTSKYYMRQSYESTAKRLTATFGSSLGSNVTIAFANAHTVEIRTAQTVGTTYEIPKSFWACLIINRALTGQETTDLTTYLSGLTLSYVNTYDFYCASAANGGNDANSGLTALLPKTILGGHNQLLASATGSKLAVLGGTEAMAFDSGSTTTAKTHHVYYLNPTVLDKAETPGVGSSSCYGVNANSWTLNINGEGNLTIQNYGNNGYGTANSATGNMHDVHIVNAFDGMTSHGTSTCRLRRSTSGPNGKSAFANTGTASVIATESNVFYAKIGSTLGGGLFGEKGVSGDYYNDDYLPDPAMTTSMAHFTWTRTQASTGAGAQITVRKGRFSAPHIAVPATVAAVSACFNTTFSDCYMNGVFWQPDTGPSDMEFVRCFGPKFLFRPRRTSTATWGLNHCAFTGVTSTNHYIDGSVFNGTTDTFGTGTVQNSVFRGGGNPAIFASAGNEAAFNTAVSLLNNGFNTNTANYTVGVTPDGTDVTSAPSLVNPTTDMELDWCVTAAAYIGAGTSGSNIGFVAGDIP